MQEQSVSTNPQSTYWLIGGVIAVLLIGLVVLMVGKKDEQPDVANTGQALVIPEIETGIGPVESVEDVESVNYDFSGQLPLYGQDSWKFAREGQPLPELDASDAEYTQDLLAVAAQLKLGLFKKQQIRKTIFSINDMAQGLRPPAKRLREIAFSQPFSVTEVAGKMYMSTQAYHRYDRLAQAVNSIDKEGAVALYQKYLPLFQTVFVEFSYPENYQVLDSIKAATGKILQAPVIRGKIELIRPTVRYKFADPKLEKLSALDKQMLRMGPDNTRMIQNKLRELIEALIAAEQR